MMEFIEKRTKKRVKSALPVHLISSATKGSPALVSSFNLSLNGICFQTELPLGPHEEVQLEFPTSSGKLQLNAEVIWKQENQHGCKFVDVDPITMSRLSQWLYPPFEP